MAAQKATRRPEAAILKLGGAENQTQRRHAKQSALLDIEDGSRIDDGQAVGIRAGLDQLVLRLELFFEGRLGSVLRRQSRAKKDSERGKR
ncbi:MAG: hypothetical protein WBW85_23705 [Terriglobales bacterium]